MAAKKFNCTFSVRQTTEKTYVVTNLPLSIPEEDLAGFSPPDSQTIRDIASDIIQELLRDGTLSLDKDILIQTDVSISFVEFVKTPKEIKED